MPQALLELVSAPQRSHYLSSPAAPPAGNYGSIITHYRPSNNGDSLTGLGVMQTPAAGEGCCAGGGQRENKTGNEINVALKKEANQKITTMSVIILLHRRRRRDFPQTSCGRLPRCRRQQTVWAGAGWAIWLREKTAAYWSKSPPPGPCWSKRVDRDKHGLLAGPRNVLSRTGRRPAA